MTPKVASEEKHILEEKAKTLGLNYRGTQFYTYMHSLAERRAFWSALHFLKTRRKMSKDAAIKYIADETGIEAELREKVLAPLLEKLYDQAKIPAL